MSAKNKVLRVKLALNLLGRTKLDPIIFFAQLFLATFNLS